MGILESVFLTPIGKYVLELIFASLAIVFNKISDPDLKGDELFFKAPKIKTGTFNWTMFTIGIVYAIIIDHSNFNKSMIMFFVLIIFIIVMAGCWRVVGLGRDWRGSETFANIAMYGGPLTLSILSLIVFIFLDTAQI
jgi:hypothetical protein